MYVNKGHVSDVAMISLRIWQPRENRLLKLISWLFLYVYVPWYRTFWKRRYFKFVLFHLSERRKLSCAHGTFVAYKGMYFHECGTTGRKLFAFRGESNRGYSDSKYYRDSTTRKGKCVNSIVCLCSESAKLEIRSKQWRIKFAEND